MLYGIDISNHQKDLQLASVAKQIQFVIVKATEGTGFVDLFCDMFYQQAKKLGLSRAFYHYGRGNSATREADYFMSNTAGYRNDAIPVLDWEEDQSVAWVNEFVRRYHDVCGVWPWIYANPWRFNQGGVEANCGRWAAGYPKTYTSLANGATKFPYKVEGTVCAWQFSDKINLSGYDGLVDGDVFYGDVEAWNKYAGASAGVSTPAASVLENDEYKVTIERK